MTIPQNTPNPTQKYPTPSKVINPTTIVAHTYNLTDYNVVGYEEIKC